MSLITAPGLYPDITPLQYFGEPCPTPACSNSSIKTLLKRTALECWHEHPALNRDPELSKSSAEQRRGDIVHQLALGKGRGYEIGNYRTFGSDAAKDFKADCERAGTTPILAHQYEAALRMAHVAKARVQAFLNAEADRRGLRTDATDVPYETEVVIAWIELTPFGPVWCRGMLDLWCDLLKLGLDMKITKSLHDDQIDRQIDNMGWDTQGVLYPRGLGAIFPDVAGRARYADLMISPDAPHVSRLVTVNKSWRSVAELDCERGLARFAQCLAEDNWPGYGNAIEEREPKPWRLDRSLQAAIDEDDD